MRDAVIGIVCGVSAVVLAAILRPAPRLQPLPAAAPDVLAAREVSTGGTAALAELTRRYLPATQPDPVVARMSRPVPALDARGMTLERVLDWWAGEAGVNLFVDWRSLEAAGIKTDDVVGARLAPGPAVATLKAVLWQAGGGNIRLGYRVDDGIVHVATSEDLARFTVTRVYDVRDIIADALAGGRSWNGPVPPTELDAAEALVTLIQEEIEPETWRYAGGTSGGIRYFAGRLVVTQTEENQDAVMGLLGALRAVK